jgi:hypothetical protein
MVQLLLPLLPRELGTAALAMAVIGCLIGVLLWLLGSRFSRSLISLVLVALGGWTGLFLPRWFGWAIDGWAPAVGLALVLGVSGFFLHRLWVGVGLGLVLAIWAGVVTWMLCGGGADASWSWPTLTLKTQLLPYAHSLWENLPGGVQKILPYACGAALLSGVCAGMLWPRFGVATLYSALGVTLIVTLGLTAVNFSRPRWIGMLPGRTAAQALTLVGLVAFGALLQWRIVPSGGPAPAQGGGGGGAPKGKSPGSSARRKPSGGGGERE